MSLPPSMIEKSALRRMLLNARHAIGPSQKSEWDAAIAAQLEQRLQAQPVETLGVFWPIRGEPDLLALYERLAAAGIALALPVVAGKARPLEFAAWKPGDSMINDAFGVPTPAEKRLVALPQALLVPCVGFNAGNFRLGYGGGFYDRTLAVSPRPLTLGIAYSCQAIEFTPGPRDIALDHIVTERL
ncbi:MAG: 5-formyltetrahydrofolate cyclo-ligase [Burkholderiaceae bacterium]|nr:5-formyltetrahydrofolate cyclo-ligase [Burkholderiaceae bacterium]